MLLGGCATSRSVVSVNAPAAYSAATSTSGVAVKIAKVEDAREFESKPKEPFIPSLSDGDIKNSATTSRAIARKRNGYGQALGDVLLPEGQSVASIMGDATAAAFREAGYRVLTPNDPGYAQAAAVDVKIKQYWSWFRPGFWSVTLTCIAEVEVKAPIAGLETGITANARTEDHMQVVVESDWQKIAGKGLGDLTADLTRKLPRQTASQ